MDLLYCCLSQWMTSHPCYAVVSPAPPQMSLAQFVLLLPDDSDVDNPGIGTRLLSRCRPRGDCRQTLASHWPIPATLSSHWLSGAPDCTADRTSESGKPDDTFLFSTSGVSQKKDNKETQCTYFYCLTQVIRKRDLKGVQTQQCYCLWPWTGLQIWTIQRCADPLSDSRGGG